MRTHFFSLILSCFTVLTFSQNALAIFDAQLMLGKRWFVTEDTSNKEGGRAAFETTISAHVDPIPLVPVAIGANFTSFSFSEKDFGADAKSATGSEIGLELMGWIPMVPMFTPYAKLRIPVISSHALETESGGVKTEITSKNSGLLINFGAEFGAPIIPLVEFYVEVSIGSQKTKIDEYKVDGTKQPLNSDQDKEYKWDSQAILVGAGVGI